VLAIMHPDLIPPSPIGFADTATAEWKTEFDVTETLRELGHDVRCLGLGDDLGALREAIADFDPHIVFNLAEAFADIPSLEHNVVAYLELKRVPYTGCGSRGLMLARDKPLAKKLLAYHRIPGPDFTIVAHGRKVRRPARLGFPLIVKSATLDASIGISQASVVQSDARLAERVQFVHDSIGTDALIEQYIDGRELYVGITGNRRLETFPVWELAFDRMQSGHRIASERLKWNTAYQKRHGIRTHEAKDLSQAERSSIQAVCKRVYRSLYLNGYGRIDLRLDAAGRVYVMEANPNPQLAFGEDFAESAERAGVSYNHLIQRIVNLGLRWTAHE